MGDSKDEPNQSSKDRLYTAEYFPAVMHMKLTFVEDIPSEWTTGGKLYKKATVFNPATTVAGINILTAMNKLSMILSLVGVLVPGIPDHKVLMNTARKSRKKLYITP